MEPASIAATALVAVLTWVTLSGRDAWPFSAYPMFSELRRLDQVSVYCIAFETSAGSLEWWRPRHYRYAERIGQSLQRFAPSCNATAAHQAALSLARRQTLRHALRLVELELGVVPAWNAVHVVRRSVNQRDGRLTVHNDTVEVVPVRELTAPRTL